MSTTTKLGKGNFTPIPMTNDAGEVIYQGRGRFPVTFHAKIVAENIVPEIIEGKWVWSTINPENKKHIKMLEAAKEMTAKIETRKTEKKTKKVKAKETTESTMVVASEEPETETAQAAAVAAE